MERDGDDLLEALMSGILDPGGFSHRDHVATAFAALERFEFFKAAQVYADGLRALTIRAGVPEKFNATVTLTFLSLIAEKMSAGYKNADALLSVHPDLLNPGLMGDWYSKDRMTCDLARRVALMPDRAALNI